MRKSFFCEYKPDKKFLIAFAITLICAIICGIVLYKPVTCNEYFRNFTAEYVYNAFNFKNAAILLPHLLADLIYLYILFFICYFTKFKYAALSLIFIRGIFIGVYSVLLVAVCSFSGVLVLLLIFLPSNLIPIAFCLIIMECCKLFDKKFAVAVPAVFSVFSLIILILLLNVVFRIIIIIV